MCLSGWQTAIAWLMLFAAPAGTPALNISRPSGDGSAERLLPQVDARSLALRHYFEKRNCPLKDAAADFITAADKYNLDWTLLPAIAMIESGGGKAFTNNNVLGWDSGNRKFTSVTEGIEVVASRLGTSARYRNKNLEGILGTYNPLPEYAASIKSVMRKIRASE